MKLGVWWLTRNVHSWCFTEGEEQVTWAKVTGREVHRALTHLHTILAKHWPDSHRHRHDGPSVHVHWAIDGWQVSLP